MRMLTTPPGTSEVDGNPSRASARLRFDFLIHMTDGLHELHQLEAMSRDPESWNEASARKALASLCQALWGTNEFLYLG